MRRTRREDRGAVLAYTALCIVVLLTMAAFTLDLGQQMLRRREAQAAADAVAMDLVRMADGRDAGTIVASTEWSQTLSDSATRNGFTAPDIAATLGTWSGTTFTASASTGIPDAVQVVARDTVVYSFARIVGLSSGGVRREAVAGRVNRALFSVGSTLLALQTGNSAVLNPLLTDLLGGSINLSTLSYQGLVFADGTLGDLATAAGFGTVDEFLDSDTTVADFSLAAAQVLTNQGDTSNAAIFDGLAAATVSNPNFRVGDIITATPGVPTSAENLTVNFFELLLAGATLSNGSNFIDMASTITAPGGATLSSFTLQVTQAPQFGHGRVGDATATARTAQLTARATMTVPINTSVTVVGLGVLSVTGNFTIPVTLTGAEATGTLAAIDCSNTALPNIDVGATLDPVEGASHRQPWHGLDQDRAQHPDRDRHHDCVGDAERRQRGVRLRGRHRRRRDRPHHVRPVEHGQRPQHREHEPLALHRERDLAAGGAERVDQHAEPVDRQPEPGHAAGHHRSRRGHGRGGHHRPLGQLRGRDPGEVEGVSVDPFPLGPLRYLYVGSSDVTADLAWYNEALGADLVWRFQAFGADVAAVRMDGGGFAEGLPTGAPTGPLVILADHRPVPSVLPIYAVRSLTATTEWLAATGWLESSTRVEVPDGPCLVVRDPSGNEIALLEVVRPDAMPAAYRRSTG